MLKITNVWESTQKIADVPKTTENHIKNTTLLFPEIQM